MSWTKITGRPEQEIPLRCWVGGYDDEGKWQETSAYQSAVYHNSWYSINGSLPVRHLITHFAPVDPPPPPPKPVSLRDELIALKRDLASTAPHIRASYPVKAMLGSAIERLEQIIGREDAVEPPPKPVSAREAVEKALEHLDTWWEQQGGYGDSEIMSAKVLLRKAIAREEES